MKGGGQNVFAIEVDTYWIETPVSQFNYRYFDLKTESTNLNPEVIQILHTDRRTLCTEIPASTTITARNVKISHLHENYPIAESMYLHWWVEAI